MAINQEAPKSPEFALSSGRTPWDPEEEEDIIKQPLNKVLEEGPPTQQHFHSIPTAEGESLIEGGQFKELICTADLEAIIEPNGNNFVYMAAWYNNLTNKVHHIEPNSPNQEIFLQNFWRDLIKNNKDRTCYFHNWAGYDSILSLPYLLNCLPGLSFKPIVKDGGIMSLEVYQGTTKLLTIKDSLKVLPGSLAKLAKDWKVETLKEIFPITFI